MRGSDYATSARNSFEHSNRVDWGRAAEVLIVALPELTLRQGMVLLHYVVGRPLSVLVSTVINLGRPPISAKEAGDEGGQYAVLVKRLEECREHVSGSDVCIRLEDNPHSAHSMATQPFGAPMPELQGDGG